MSKIPETLTERSLLCAQIDPYLPSSQNEPTKFLEANLLRDEGL